MRIVGVYLNPRLSSGGHRRYIELIEGLAQRGNQVILIKSRAFSYRLPRGVEVVDLDFQRRRGPIPYALQYRAAVRRGAAQIIAHVGNADFVVVHGETHFFSGLRIARLVGAHLLFAYRSIVVEEVHMHVRAYPDRRFSALRLLPVLLKALWYERRIGQNADLLVFQSEFDRESYLSRVPSTRTKTYIVPGNIGGPRFKSEYRNINQSERLQSAIFVGNLGYRKGFWHLIEAFHMLCRDGVPVRLSVVAAVDSPRAEEFLRRNDMDGQVELLGKIVDPLPLMGRSDLVIVPSVFDSYPDVALEALHVGTPVIGSRVGGIPHILHHDELLFEPGSPEAIYRRVKELYSDQDSYRRARDLCLHRRQALCFDWAAEWERAMKLCLHRE